MKCRECPDYAKCVKESNLAIKRKTCKKAKTKYVMTNADRIRAMSDEELAAMLKDYKDCNNCIISNGKHCYQICEEESGLLKWLQQLAEGE